MKKLLDGGFITMDETWFLFLGTKCTFHFSLTEKGYKNQSTVVGSLLAYIEFIRSKGVIAEIKNELIKAGD